MELVLFEKRKHCRHQAYRLPINNLHTLLKASIFQEDTLFKTLNSEIIIILLLLYTLFKSQDSKIHFLFCGTDPLKQNRGITPPPPPQMHTHIHPGTV